METLNNQENQPQPPTEAAPTPPALDGTPRKKNYLFWILGILGLTIVLVIILLFFIGKSKSISSGSLTQSPASQEQTAVDSTNVDISTWKTYINRVRGFEFKYPNNLEIYSDMGMDYSDDSIYLYSKSNKYPYCGVQSISKKLAAEEKNLGNMRVGSLKELIDNSYKQAIENQLTLKRVIQPVQEGIFSGKKMYKYVAEEEGIDMIWGSGVKERSIYTILALEHNDSYIMIGCGDNNIYSQILSTFEFTQTNDSEVIVPNVIQQLIPQVKWELQQSISEYPLLDFGVSVLVSQRTGTIINPDVAGNPYDISDLLSDQSKLTELGWTEDLPKGASGPLTSIIDYHKTINGVDKILRFVIENTDYASSTNPSDNGTKIKCPCVNKITVFQQQ